MEHFPPISIGHEFQHTNWSIINYPDSSSSLKEYFRLFVWNAAEFRLHLTVSVLPAWICTSVEPINESNRTAQMHFKDSRGGDTCRAQSWRWRILGCLWHCWAQCWSPSGQMQWCHSPPHGPATGTHTQTHAINNLNNKYAVLIGLFGSRFRGQFQRACLLAVPVGCIAGCRHPELDCGPFLWLRNWGFTTWVNKNTFTFDWLLACGLKRVTC